MNIKRNGTYIHIIQDTIKAMLNGALIMALIVSCTPLCNKFKIIVEKDGIKKSGTKIYGRKEISDAIWDAISYIYINYGEKT